MARPESVAFNRSGTSNRGERYGPGPVGPGVTQQRTVLVPPRRPALVRRERLLRELADLADDVPLALFVAPAGFGKTTLLNQWAESTGQFAWVHLEEADNDPIRLLRHIALAMHRIRPIDYAAWRGLGAADESTFEVVLPRLMTAVVGTGPPWTLVLDDLHVLRGELAADVIGAFVGSLPAGFRVAAAGRSQAGLKVSSLRRQGKCIEYGPRELAFTEDEVDSVLRTTGARSSPSVVADLVRRTEGWPAGVYLSALAMRGGTDRKAPEPESSEFVFEYLREEVLAHESEEQLRFLRRTAPLAEMSAPLCDAVLDTTGSAARLNELETRNLFVVRPDPGRLWYRYRPVFREMLLAELRRLEPVEEELVHRRAAQWYDAHGYVDQAIGHALESRDPEPAARLIVRYAHPYLGSGRLAAVREWIAELPDTAIDDFPALAVVAGWTWALVGEAARAQECLHAAERGAIGTVGIGWPTDTAADGGSLVCGIAALRAALAPYGVDQMLVDAQRAFSLAPPGSPGYPGAATLLGVAQLLGGDPATAKGSLERAAHFGRDRHRYSTSFALAQLSLLAADKDDWVVAKSCAVEALDIFQAVPRNDYPAGIAVYVARARVALHERNMRLARDSADRALALYDTPSATAFPWYATQMAIALGRIGLDLDDFPMALDRLADVRRHVVRLPSEGVLGRQGTRLAKDIARHGDRLRYSYAVTLTAAEMRVLQLLPTHLTLSEIADALYISRNTVKTQVASIYGKLHSSTRAEAVRTARERDLVE